jgi:ankyrin repeat domain-containing protein 50
MNSEELHAAAQKSKAAVTQVLGAKPYDNIRYEQGKTILHILAQYGYEESTQQCLRKWPTLRDARDDDGATALHYAAWYGHEKVAGVLLDHGADADITDNDGDNVLHCAVGGAGQIAVVKRLLSKGIIDVDTKGSQGTTALGLALKEGNDLVVKLLLENGAKFEAAARKWSLF